MIHANPTQPDQCGKKRLHHQLDSTRHLYSREHAAQCNDSKALDHHGEAEILHQKSLNCSVLSTVNCG
jgi:hypothetical protein